LRADNIEVKRRGLWQSRRGTDLYLAPFLHPAVFLGEYLNAYTPANDSLIVWDSLTGLTSVNQTTQVSTLLGGFAFPEVGYPRAIPSNQNLYLLTGGGVMRMESQTTAPVAAGVPAGLDVQAGFNYQYTVPSTGFASNPNFAIAGSFPTGTITLTSVVAGNTVYVDGILLTASSSTQDSTHFLVGANDIATASNLVTTIGANSFLTTYMTASNVGGTSNVVTLTALTRGITFANSMLGSANLVVSGRTAAIGTISLFGVTFGDAAVVAATPFVATASSQQVTNVASSTSSTVVCTTPINLSTSDQGGVISIGGTTYSYTAYVANTFSGVTPSPAGISVGAIVAYYTTTQQGSYGGTFYYTLGSSDAITAANLAASINSDTASLGVVAYATGNTIIIEAVTPGTAGNSILINGTPFAHFTLSGATLAGGNDIGLFQGGSDGTALVGNSQVAYRFLFGKRDINSNLLEGTPSGRGVVISPSYNITAGLVSRSGSTVTITQFGHGLVAGENIVIGNASNDAMFLPGNTDFLVLGAVDLNHFTINSAGFQGVNESVITVTRTGRNVVVSSTIPTGVSDGTYFYQVYRSVGTISGTSSPSDDMYLDFEAPVPLPGSLFGISASSGIVQLTATASITGLSPGSVVQLPSGLPGGVPAGQYTVLTTPSPSTFTVYASAAGSFSPTPASGTYTPIAVGTIDITPDSLLGADLYTNQSDDGPAATNDIPPDSVDIAKFKTTTFYAAPLRAASIDIQLLSTDPTVGLRIGDVVYVGTTGGHITAAAAENATAGIFQIFSTGNVANDLLNTVASIVRTINRTSGLGCTAVVTSSQDSLPGSFAIQATNVTQTITFTPTAHVSAWSPSQGQSQPPIRVLNQVAYSKIDQPDAVPVLNTYAIGNTEDTVRRINALRDGLFILKDDGAFILSGNDSSDFQVAALDLTLTFPSPQCVAPLSNTLIALTNQGFMQLTSTGSRNITFPDIDDLVQSLLAPAMLPVVASVGFAVGYESEHSVIFWLPTVPADTVPTQCLVYNLYTNSWTSRTDMFQAGTLYTPTDKLYVAAGNQLYQERKSPFVPGPAPGSVPIPDYRDYVDMTLATTLNILACTQYDSLTLSSVANLQPGDVLVQGTYPTWNWVNVLSVDTVNNIVTVDRPQLWTLGTGNVTAFRGINCTITWVPFFGDNPGAGYIFREAALLFKSASFSQLQLGFHTDNDPLDDFEPAIASELLIYRGDNSKTVRVGIPSSMERGNQLTMTVQLNDGWMPWTLQGLSLIYETVSERMSV
jgi:hypothetical protein